MPNAAKSNKSHYQSKVLRLCNGVLGSGENGVKYFREHGVKKTREQGAKESILGSREQRILGISSNNFT